ncbi:hypothetical protein V8B97DRAFT_770688 [Scleroderma yunnanense]
MSDNVLAQHPAALKVGGRRLSISSKAKPYATSTSPKTTTGSDNAEYPRPAQGDEQPDATPHKEEESPKKEKKHEHRGQNDKRLRENASHKLESTRPTRDHMTNKHGFGAAGRIAQPVSKVFAI